MQKRTITESDYTSILCKHFLCSMKPKEDDDDGNLLRPTEAILSLQGSKPTFSSTFLAAKTLLWEEFRSLVSLRMFCAYVLPSLPLSHAYDRWLRVSPGVVAVDG